MDVIHTNLKGAYNTIKSVSRQMMKQRNGKIINISSVSGVMGNAGQANYSSAKAGLIGLTKSMAKELCSRNITVNAVAPGFIETDMTKELPQDELKHLVPMKRFGKPEEVAALVGFLCSDDSSYITGEVISINGGLY
jgi:3-oxoacyl-[acyl-carrier protein] reductase